MKKKKAQKPQKDKTGLQSAPIAENPLPTKNTENQPALGAAEQKPESSQNNPSPAGGQVEGSKATSGSDEPTTPQQPAISEEDRKALENLATAIGIPQIVAEIKRIGEQVNVLTGAKTGILGTSAVGGAAAGFLKPIMDKAPELIDGIMKWISGTGQPQQPTMISGIDKEIMETAIKTTTEARAKATQVADLLLKNMMQGGSVMVDQNGNAVILKPKLKEEPEKK